uniref:TLC domain-containing protein n=1 Tax=Mucochytrium quahogii TaxID=96639 RepID=A0A7S2W2J5_9STRA|mmetsp:Transcript_10402/g.22561  ORF Transcript_10402/g.22561 Transcript_10402/m.22561 type:complete len:250 (+) Transcript_10402:397-1146(+)
MADSVGIKGFFAFGYLTKTLDQTNTGGVQSRCTNAFCATTTLFLSLASLDLFAEMCNYSLYGVNDILFYNSPRHFKFLEHQKAQADTLGLYMFAYMTQDMVVRYIYRRLEFRYFIHHMACVVPVTLCFVADQTPIFLIAATISELSTPVVCLFEVGQREGGYAKKYIMPCGVLMNILFPLRFLWFCYLTAAAFYELCNSGVALAINPDNISFSALIILLLCNGSWWLQILLGTVKEIALMSKKKQKKTT